MSGTASSMPNGLAGACHSCTRCSASREGPASALTPSLLYCCCRYRLHTPEDYWDVSARLLSVSDAAGCMLLDVCSCWAISWCYSDHCATADLAHLGTIGPSVCVAVPFAVLSQEGSHSSGQVEQEGAQGVNCKSLQPASCSYHNQEANQGKSLHRNGLLDGCRECNYLVSVFRV